MSISQTSERPGTKLLFTGVCLPSLLRESLAVLVVGEIMPGELAILRCDDKT